MYNLKGINIDEGTTRFGGNTDRYLKVLFKFADNHSTAMAFDANATIDSEFKTYIHTLKGMAGNLSITGLYELCNQLDTSINNSQPDKAIYDLMLVEYESVVQTIIKFQAEYNSITK